MVQSVTLRWPAAVSCWRRSRLGARARVRSARQREPPGPRQLFGADRYSAIQCATGIQTLLGVKQAASDAAWQPGASAASPMPLYGRRHNCHFRAECIEATRDAPAASG